MVQFKSIIALLPLFLSVSLASPSARNNLESRESCEYTCGSTCYWSSDVSAAKAKGYSLYESGDTIDDYPHEYHDYEGFDFPVSGTYYEYPIMSDYDVYTGGSPGADRVIFNGDDELAGVITHTGASGDDFVACSS
ncbi:extracellular guanyl-specific ribonuclease RntA [Aspergillus neoniger CBS 115656]|uniref:ribonuclease T1 n=1 Tax=Aspergillus neoniger (strain CBS 115656) TaxID=1448310 RepID=A0A318YYN5_ASPNB|nr:ribonuclease Ms [Aspergillus neoniger CBS 115656]PYH30032.1 ribonuclease Ms [Aspergillus neoniger CBS 115656]